MKVLIIGGSRYFGKRLTTLFLAQGTEVTRLNRLFLVSKAAAANQHDDRISVTERLQKNHSCPQWFPSGVTPVGLEDPATDTLRKKKLGVDREPQAATKRAV